MNRMALKNGQKIVETTVSVSSKETIKSMDRLAIIQGQKLLKERLDTKKNQQLKLWIEWL